MQPYIVHLRWPIEVDYLKIEVEAENEDEAGERALAIPGLANLPGWERDECHNECQLYWVETKEGFMDDMTEEEYAELKLLRLPRQPSLANIDHLFEPLTPAGKEFEHP
jgi:hypothetical protein